MKYKDLPYIEHILEAIRDIEESIHGLSKEEFSQNKDVRDANIRRLEVIGEAVKNISHKLREEYPKIEWNKIAVTRDKIIHHYFGINLEIIWAIIKNDLPPFKKQIQEIKDHLIVKDS